MSVCRYCGEAAEGRRYCSRWCREAGRPHDLADRWLPRDAAYRSEAARRHVGDGVQ